MRLLFPTLFLLIVSCIPRNVPKTVTLPEWVTRQPSDNNYWYGVGTADINTGDDPHLAARQRALSEIAEQLQVNIQSELVDVVEAANTEVNEFTRSIIKTRVNASLDFVDYADSYRSSQMYYVLARLNKKSYFENLAREKRQAEEIAGDLIRSAAQELTGTTFSSLALAVETISPYLDQSPSIEYPFGSGKSQTIYRVAAKMLRNFNDRIDLRLEPEVMNIKPFVNYEQRIDVKALDKKTGSAIGGISVMMSVPDLPENELLITDKNGQTYCQLQPARSRAGSYTIIFSVDYSSMLKSEALSLVKLVPRKFPVKVTILAPRIVLTEAITNLGKQVAYDPLLGSIKGCFEQGYSAVFVEDETTADLKLTLVVATEQRRERLSEKYPYFLFATGNLSLVNVSTGEEIMNVSLGEHKGADFDSAVRAGMAAITKLEKNFALPNCQ